MSYIKKLINYCYWIAHFSLLQAIFIAIEKMVRLLLYPFKIFNHNQNIDFYVLWFDYCIQSTLGKFYIRSWTDDEFIVSPMFEDELDHHFNLNWWIFLDIWSHIWKYSVKIWTQSKYNKIIAFEANSQTYKSVKINLILNNIDNAIVENMAVWEKKWELIFLESKKNTWISRIVDDNWAALLKEWAIRKKDMILKKIPIISIDEYLKYNLVNLNSIKLIKIDTEWNEFSVLLWMRNLLKKNKWVKLIVEITENLHEITAYMKWFWYICDKLSETYFIFSV